MQNAQHVHGLVTHLVENEIAPRDELPDAGRNVIAPQPRERVSNQPIEPLRYAIENGVGGGWAIGPDIKPDLDEVGPGARRLAKLTQG